MYASPRGGKAAGVMPVENKAVLVDALEAALEPAEAACREAGADLPAILSAVKADRAPLIGAAVDRLIAPDERRRNFLRLTDAAVRAYKAVLPDNAAAPYFLRVAAFAVVADAVRNRVGPAGLPALAARIEAMLNGAITGADVTAPIRTGTTDGLLDLSGLDFDKLGSLFTGQPRTAAEALRAAAETKAAGMAAINPTRADLVARLEELVAAYNAASLDAASFLAKLKDYCADLDEGERRHAREGLTEAELAIFDLLTRPEPKLTATQETAVKAIARVLLTKLEKLLVVRDWHARQQPRAAVFSAIRVELDGLPEDAYPLPMWNAKVEDIWQFVAQRYGGAGATALLTLPPLPLITGPDWRGKNLLHAT